MKRVIAVAVLVFTLIFGVPCFGVQHTFQWNISPSIDVAGYRLYMKDINSGALTQLGNDIPGRDTWTATVEVTEPVGAGKFWVVAKAYDSAGNESAESNLAYLTDPATPYVWSDTTPPEPPTMLQVLQQIAGALDRIASALEAK